MRRATVAGRTWLYAEVGAPCRTERQTAMKDFAKDFYRGPAWKNCRDAYTKSVGGLCERCLKKGIYVAGEIVHHKQHLTPENINDSRITLAWGNLELLCRNCHADEHRKYEKRFTVDEFGRVTAR